MALLSLAFSQDVRRTAIERQGEAAGSRAETPPDFGRRLILDGKGPQAAQKPHKEANLNRRPD
jgi:hypothetical protein